MTDLLLFLDNAFPLEYHCQVMMFPSTRGQRFALQVMRAATDYIRFRPGADERRLSICRSISMKKVP